ncbi:cytochrome P450 [Aspergillus aculeatinus CBS 121060]|uniref:Cytochrome P450 n=1 Tax=Aspergillus aculeatinus CBS 121060 TaxID=1448322 RepID=A0ACD1H1D2_9EURO|nr:cytochrome P450 [Aspergillus aculeatinus CBS 121060]RAH67354.1 cytochrome P450 [Aspergillus aculeatinus CBS 121060]
MAVIQRFPAGPLSDVPALGLLVVVISVPLIGIVLYNVFFHPLAQYPGPRSMAASRIPYLLMTLRGRPPQEMNALHKRYGHVVRVAPNELSFISSDAWRPIYGTRPGHGQKPKDRHAYPPSADNVPSIDQSNDADHSRFRRLLSHAFSDTALRGQEPIIRGYVELLMQRLREHARHAQTPLDMVAWYNFCTFDIIGDLAFGEPFDCLRNAAYHDWVRLIFSSVKVASYLNVARRLPGTQYLVRAITPRRVLEQQRWHVQLTAQKVQARLNMTNERPDFFASILKHQGNSEKGISVPEMIANASTLIIAGSETTATLLSGVTFLLLKNPRVMDKLQQEVRSAFATEEEITLDSVNRLHYCLAVLTEGLRLFPPVGVGLPRVVDPQGDVISGGWVPGGTSVSIPHYAAYRSPANFTDPDAFVPERHLGDPRYAADDRDVLQPFSFGPRNCIGRNLAYVEMRIILARMIFNFDMELEDTESDWLDQECHLLWDKSALMVKLKPRGLVQ